MKRLIPLVVLLAIFFVSCNNRSKDTSNKSAILTVDSLLANADQLIDKTITVEGLCTHLCTRSGKKLFLEGSADSIIIRAEAEKPFRQECIDKKVSVTGKLIEERIDEAYLANWENELNADTAKHESCKTEKRASGQHNLSSSEQRIADYRVRIAEEKAKSGKEYLSFYHIETESYRVVE